MNHDYVFDGFELSSAYKAENGFTYFKNYRFEQSSGDLLVEVALANTGFTNWDLAELIPISSHVEPGARVIGYGTCVPTEYNP